MPASAPSAEPAHSGTVAPPGPMVGPYASGPRTTNSSPPATPGTPVTSPTTTAVGDPWWNAPSPGWSPTTPAGSATEASPTTNSGSPCGSPPSTSDASSTSASTTTATPGPWHEKNASPGVSQREPLRNGHSPYPGGRLTPSPRRHFGSSLPGLAPPTLRPDPSSVDGLFNGLLAGDPVHRAVGGQLHRPAGPLLGRHRRQGGRVGAVGQRPAPVGRERGQQPQRRGAVAVERHGRGLHRGRPGVGPGRGPSRGGVDPGLRLRRVDPDEAPLRRAGGVHAGRVLGQEVADARQHPERAGIGP